MTVEIAVYVPLVCPARLFLMINSANTIDVNALLSSSTKRVHYRLLASLLWGEGGLLVKFQTLEFEADKLCNIKISLLMGKIFSSNGNL